MKLLVIFERIKNISMIAYNIKINYPNYTMSITETSAGGSNFISTSEALELLNSRGVKISRPTLIAKAKRGEVNYTRLSDKIMKFDLRDIMRIIENKRC